MTAQLKLDHSISFMLAGNATITVVRPARTLTVKGVEQEDPEKRFTYKVRRAPGDEEDRPWFVKVLTGPQNTADYQFLGTIFLDERTGVVYRHGRKSSIRDDAPSARGIAWLVENISELVMAKRELAKAEMFGNPAAESKIQQVEAKLNKMEYWHQGTCGRCNRDLTVPRSIINGIGPECEKKFGLPNALELLARNL